MIQYVNENYSKHLNLKDLCAQFYINMNYCCALFKRNLGSTFSEYLLKLRIQKASELILTTTLPIQQIAELTGYNDYYYFQRVFKSITASLPSAIVTAKARRAKDFRPAQKGEQHEKTDLQSIAPAQPTDYYMAIAIGAKPADTGYLFCLAQFLHSGQGHSLAASTMDQMEQSIETRITGILNIGQRLSYNRYTQSFLTGISEPELMDTYRIVEGLATDLVSVNNDIASIALTSDYLSFTQVYQSLPLAVQRERFLRYPLDSENIFFTGTLQNTVDGSQVFAVVVPSYSIYDTTPDFSHRLGSVLLFCHAQEIVKTLKLGTATSGTEVFAIDDNGLVISSTSYVENSRTSFGSFLSFL